MDEVPRERMVDNIIELLYKCQDVELLDFILQLLQKVVG